MSGGPATVPAWWTKIKQPQAHERLLGSIEFYRRKWDGGAHWASSEDAAASKVDSAGNTGDQGACGVTSQGTVTVRKEWPGYNREEAREGYLTRFQTGKVNRKAFEKASQKPKVPSRAAVDHARSRRGGELVRIQQQQEGETETNYWQREKQRRDNKMLATEASELIRPRPGAHKPHYKQISARSVSSERSEWYGRRNTRPW